MYILALIYELFFRTYQAVSGPSNNTNAHELFVHYMNSDISYFGVGGKQAIFFIGNATRVCGHNLECFFNVMCVVVDMLIYNFCQFLLNGFLCCFYCMKRRDQCTILVLSPTTEGVQIHFIFVSVMLIL